VLALLLPLGCSDDSGAANAMRVVDEFQTALRAGDRSRCRALITEESATALPSIPWHEVRTRQPLRVLGAEPRNSGYLVQVADPNEGQRQSEFVVVREYGRVVVDLVASAGLTAEFTERPVENGAFEPRELTPADYDLIRQIELARPPR